MRTLRSCPRQGRRPCLIQRRSSLASRSSLTASRDRSFEYTSSPRILLDFLNQKAVDQASLRRLTCLLLADSASHSIDSASHPIDSASHPIDSASHSIHSVSGSPGSPNAADFQPGPPGFDLIEVAPQKVFGHMEMPASRMLMRTVPMSLSAAAKYRCLYTADALASRTQCVSRRGPSASRHRYSGFLRLRSSAPPPHLYLVCDHACVSTATRATACIRSSTMDSPCLLAMYSPCLLAMYPSRSPLQVNSARPSFTSRRYAVFTEFSSALLYSAR
ncbi:uncharacterized protein SCHCODRAFT_02208104 [Schizophyllum commune H4-8]|uniref:uncharacterized protein n=1 Tax=Schizophyllum commune (strain H4-8 / FGSC 9210) TaxID=578458 RepID=UPI00215E1750|nr:uncharacterized protein SCHCODRAFT_02208104 [Schizophyllum commune H4-8]KAI5897179.1 hypothetical protein SCHCODRAFT_02208104 [Schizophyllum commune H4-8]